ncbi:Coi1 protein [Scheffersomyces coipomensis]|uniref:Coi1 protein n=1 Tax=Scheffersomyces coipomensis TaxID=1788519 RepID=UPI00315DE195
MVSLNLLAAIGLSLTTVVNSFDLLRDEDGFAILPPTDLVLQHLAELEAEQDPEEYTVINSIHSNGEIIKINLNTQEIQQTGLYKRDYDNEAYYQHDSKALFTREIENTSGECFNQQQQFGISQCVFEFVSYENPNNCSSDATFYSCVLDVERIQDSSVALKNMVPNPAQTRCFKSLDKAIAYNATNGACGK